MVLQTTHNDIMTVQEFDEWAELPENFEKLFEYIGGEVFEVPSNPFASAIGYNIGFSFKLYLVESGLQAHVTGEAGGYWVFGERYAPDVALLLKSKQAELAKQGYNPIAPDLAVEVDFPSSAESQKKLRFKLANYMAAGTLLWIVDPEAKEVEVYAPGKAGKLFRIGDTLDGGDVLPGFSLKVDSIFQ